MRKKIFQWIIAKDIFLEPCPKIRAWIEAHTGFTGSVCHVLKTDSQTILVVDGRYDVQARHQAKPGTEVVVGSPMDVLKRQPAGELVLDPWQFSASTIKDMAKALPQWNITFKKTSPAWPQQERCPLWSVSGLSFQEKCQKIFGDGLSYPLWITNGTDLAWLSNMRGSPEMVGYGFVWQEHGRFQLKIFTPHRAPQKPLKDISFESHFHLPVGPYFYDPFGTPQGFLTDQAHAFDLHPLKLLRAQKNPREQHGMKEAQKADALALIGLIQEMTFGKCQKTEKQWAQDLETLRQKNRAYMGPSFPTILAFGASAASIHHQPSDQEVAQGLCLLDAGGHYGFKDQDLHGTTDITRTFWRGETVDPKAKAHFTQVLQAHIELARLVFPKGTRGCHLDVTARAQLWRHGLDYAHSTGHGVGHCLAVHEAPPSISLYSQDEILPGMIFSNEPGYYQEGWGGIRLESEVLVTPTGLASFMELENLTFVPFDQKLMNLSLLTHAQRQWINAYHKRIEEELTPLCADPKMKANLERACVPVGDF